MTQPQDPHNAEQQGSGQHGGDQQRGGQSQGASGASGQHGDQQRQGEQTRGQGGSDRQNGAQGGGEDVTGLKAAVKAERDRAKAAEDQLAELQRAAMSEQERAVADALNRGRQEGSAEVGVHMAAARFATLAAGKLGDVATWVENLDLRKLVGEDGKPDEGKITGLVDTLSKAAAAKDNGGGKAPWLPQGTQNGGGAPAGDTDWIRQAIAADQ